MGACNTGWDNCDGDNTNGCEYDVSSSSSMVQSCSSASVCNDVLHRRKSVQQLISCCAPRSPMVITLGCVCAQQPRHPESPAAHTPQNPSMRAPCDAADQQLLHSFVCAMALVAATAAMPELGAWQCCR
jgi:hypothetical protein